MSKHQLHVPLKENLTDLHIGSILAVIRDLQPFLLREVVELGDTPKGRSVDGGCESAAATTFLKACSRIDSILDEESRWGLKTHNTLVAEMIRTSRAQQKFIAIQSASAEQLQAPHYLLRPTLALIDGGYIAYWGNINVVGEAVVGKGKTPNDALDDFDAAFDRTADEQIFVIAQKAGVELPKTIPPTT